MAHLKRQKLLFLQQPWQQRRPNTTNGHIVYMAATYRCYRAPGPGQRQEIYDTSLVHHHDKRAALCHGDWDPAGHVTLQVTARGK